MRQKVWSGLGLLAVLLLFGCGGLQSKVNASKTFVSTWHVTYRPLIGGQKNEGTLELTVDGSRFRILRSYEFEDPYSEEVHVGKRETIFDGKVIWMREKYYTRSQGEDKARVELAKYVPDSDFLANKLFWKLPRDIPTEDLGTEDLDGTEVRVLFSRQRTSLGADAVFRFYVDPERYLILKRQDGVGEDTSGETKDTAFGYVFVCKDIELNPTIDAKMFEVEPAGDVRTVRKFSWL